MYKTTRASFAQPAFSDHACHLSDTASYAASLYALFETAARVCPSHVALEIAESTLTYQSLSVKVNLCAVGFLTLGIEPGDVVVFSMHKSLPLIVALLAALKIGAKICILPESVSALRLRAIRQAMPVAVLVNDLGIAPNAQNDVIDFRDLSMIFTSFDRLMALGCDDLITSEQQCIATKAAQVVIGYHEPKGLFPIEFEQSAFLTVLSQLDSVLLSCEAGQRMLTATEITKPRFLVELFYAFSRNLTCVVIEEFDRWSSGQRFAAHVMDLQANVICLNHKSWACLAGDHRIQNHLNNAIAWIVLDNITVSDVVNIIERSAKEVCAYSDLLEMAICSGISSRAARLHWKCLSSSPLENTLKLPVIGAARLFLKEYVLLSAYSQEVEVQGLRITLGEIEYFIQQYPGVINANAYFSTEGLVLRVHFSWDFYSIPESQCINFVNFSMPKSDYDRLAHRIFIFLSQHLWAALPLRAIILQS